MTNEHQQNWKEMTNIMMKINKASDEMFNTIHVIDQPYGEVSKWKDELEPTWHLLHSRGNIHSIIYNQDLVSSALLAGWTKLREFYGLTRNHQSVFLLTIFKTSSEPKAFPKWHSLYHQVPNSVTFKVLLTKYRVTCNNLVNVPSTMYSFMKVVRFTHVNLEGTECRIVYNHHRKTAKIGNIFSSLCSKYHVLIYESCKIHSCELGRDKV
ncbi:hypothetical protein GmHk_18G052119 [Glycine max]|nr:hypothetical protein GmHk_18G052119 [Glycine max]